MNDLFYRCKAGCFYQVCKAVNINFIILLRVFRKNLPCGMIDNLSSTHRVLESFNLFQSPISNFNAEFFETSDIAIFPR